MRFKMVIIGIIIIFIAIPSYIVVPPLITGVMNKFSGGGTQSAMATQIFSQLGIPPIDAMIKYIQYSLIGLIVAGLFVTAFGLITKKIQKQSSVTLSIDTSQNIQKQENTNLNALHLLQERLARGEITSSQFQSLKKMVEDKI